VNIRHLWSRLLKKIKFRLNQTAYRFRYSKNERGAGNQNGAVTLLDLGTVGGTPAAVNLIHILNEIGDRKLSGRACNYLSNQFGLLKSLKDVRSEVHRSTMAKLIKDSWRNDLLDVPEVIKSYCMNVLHGKMRQVLC
jgi:hypothetical protein